MANTYLTVEFKEKDSAKALGARWDGVQRQWYVPQGHDLAPFAKWLSTTPGIAAQPTARKVVTINNPAGELAHLANKGVSLSSLLTGVAHAVTQAYRTGVWILVEVVEVRSNGGNVFMGVSERDAGGAVLAKSSAVIWQSTANSILPGFERATGAQLAPGIKLLVRGRPVFKPLHGFIIEVDAIDHEYTLGDLEARKREIRERLLADGVLTANKCLPFSWDFSRILVIAPAGAAGLGDFQAEANRLEKYGVCQFVYAYSRFQGEGAAREVCETLQNAWSQWASTKGGLPDAVVVIRGGGAVNDLAWLNDYELARFICDLPVPVLSGIGHERDSTVLDEVANCKFDTPSKVIAGIEQTISRRTLEAKTFFEQVTNRATLATQTVRARTMSLEAQVRAEAGSHLSQGKRATTELMADIRLGAMHDVRRSSTLSAEVFQEVKTEVQLTVLQARQSVPALWQQVSHDAKLNLEAAKALTASYVEAVLDESRRGTLRAHDQVESRIDSIGITCRQRLGEAAGSSKALMREIFGQGPEKGHR